MFNNRFLEEADTCHQQSVDLLVIYLTDGCRPQIILSLVNEKTSRRCSFRAHVVSGLGATVPLSVDRFVCVHVALRAWRDVRRPLSTLGKL